MACLLLSICMHFMSMCLKAHSRLWKIANISVFVYCILAVCVKPASSHHFIACVDALV